MRIHQVLLVTLLSEHVSPTSQLTPTEPLYNVVPTHRISISIGRHLVSKAAPPGPMRVTDEVRSSRKFGVQLGGRCELKTHLWEVVFESKVHCSFTSCTTALTSPQSITCAGTLLFISSGDMSTCTVEKKIRRAACKHTHTWRVHICHRQTSKPVRS